MTGYGNWIQTYTGKKFNFKEPTTDQICIEDIAHALSNICRFGGHCKKFYSVAEHSVYVSRNCSYNFKLWGLLDDASEAYINDLQRPLKKVLPYYEELEIGIMDTIILKFGLMPATRPDEVALVDNMVLMAERNQIMSEPPFEWVEESFKPLDINIECWNPTKAEHLFLLRFRELTQ